MLHSEVEDALYVQAYSKEVRSAILQSRSQRWVNRGAPSLQTPITDGVQVHSVKQATRDLFMACTHYYLERASRGLGMPREVSGHLLALYEAIKAPGDRMVVLREALAYFGRNVASVEDREVRNAIRAASLTLVLPQDSLEMPAIETVQAVRPWTYD